MTTPSQIYIYRGPIHSGKTTALQAWVKTHPTAKGFLCPDRDGLRYWCPIQEDICYPFQRDYLTPTNDDLMVGKYIFDRRIFDRGNALLLDCIHPQTEWLVIDELGKLECRGEGFARGIHSVIKALPSLPQMKVLLVIRDTLMETAIQAFHLANTEDMKLEGRG